MNLGNRKARQPTRAIWSRERLFHERALALGHVIDKSTLSNYNSALNSYLNFVTSHGFPVDPTPETLSLYTVYICHHINPRSVNTYLSGISQQLEADFPAVKEARNSALVCRTWRGCMRMKGIATVRKHALTVDDLKLVINQYHMSPHHDDLLFLAMLITRFFGLLRLGEMTFPDDSALRNWKKVTRHNTVKTTTTHYEFFLPCHKADRFFEGNKIIIPSRRFGLQPLQWFSKYLDSRDALHPVAYQSRFYPHKILLHVPPSSFLYQRRRRPIHESRRSHCTSWTRFLSLHHSSFRALGVRSFPCLYSQELRPHPRLSPQRRLFRSKPRYPIPIIFFFLLPFHYFYLFLYLLLSVFLSFIPSLSITFSQTSSDRLRLISFRKK
jgi:hypothetical protein